MLEKTVEDVINEVIMTRTVNDSCILIVEGCNDANTYIKFTVNNKIEFITACGKDNVINAVSQLDNDGYLGILGIVDADFMNLDGETPSSPNIITTDEHDLEMMIIRSKSFNNFINVYASKPKIKKFLLKNGVSDIRDVILKQALFIGCLRKYSVQSDLSLKFDGMVFNNFINKETLQIKLDKMINQILSLTQNPSIDLRKTLNHIRDMANNTTGDFYQICCGHDVIEILSIGLRKCLGNNRLSVVKPKELGDNLRISYDSKCFSSTNLYKTAEKWADKNLRHKVFE